MRAVFRNARRTENRLVALGVLDQQVIKTNFDRYASDGGARYYLLPKDKAALDDHLGR